MPRKTVEDLFARGLEQGEHISGKDFLLIGECVPGGTTTAAAFLQACRLDGASHASSSLHVPNKAQRLSLIRSGLEKAGLSSETIKRDPLAAISAIGDPMQPFAAGLALGAGQRMPVVLAGGSQMLAVFHLARLLAKAHNIDALLPDVFVITTKWVAFDGASNTRLLSESVGAQYFASAPDFTRSIHAGLRAYEDGNVKEGLGAGALMAAAQAACNLDNDALVQAVDSAYNQVVLSKHFVEI
jgi:NaMN:DMB phosphoribosyltransferase